MFISFFFNVYLGSAASLSDLRRDFEMRIGITGRQLRIEKVIYSGKEGKTSQGCPLAKWIIRRVDKEEKILCIVKRRQGHKYVFFFYLKAPKRLTNEKFLTH